MPAAATAAATSIKNEWGEKPEYILVATKRKYFTFFPSFPTPMVAERLNANGNYGNLFSRISIRIMAADSWRFLALAPLWKGML